MNEEKQYIEEEETSIDFGKLFQDLLDINKKYKLGYKVPVVDEVKKWVEAAAAASAE